MASLVTQPTNAPTRKVKAAGIGGLVTAVCVVVVDHFVPGAGDIIGPEIAAGLTAVVAAVSAWFTKERAA